MAGVTVSIDMSGLQSGLDELNGKLTDMRPLWEGIGQAVVSETVQRFSKEQAPDGSRWEQSVRAKEEGGKTLTDRGHLRDSITYSLSATGVEVGTDMVYAAIHQFGGKTAPHVIRPTEKKAWKFGNVFAKFGNVFAKKVNHPGSVIPARPFLGVGKKERAAILDEMRTHLELSS